MKEDNKQVREEVNEMKSKEYIYQAATMKCLGNNPQGTRMDVIYEAMQEYAQQFKQVNGLQWKKANGVPLPAINHRGRIPVKRDGIPFILICLHGSWCWDINDDPYSTPVHANQWSEIEWLSETPQGEDKRFSLEEIEYLLYDISNNYDHDNNAHEDGARCRACEAKKLLEKEFPNSKYLQ